MNRNIIAVSESKVGYSVLVCYLSKFHSKQRILMSGMCWAPINSCSMNKYHLTFSVISVLSNTTKERKCTFFPTNPKILFFNYFHTPITPYHVTDAVSALWYVCLILLKLLSIINSRSPMASCDIWRSIAATVNYEKLCFNGPIIDIGIFYFQNLLRISRSLCSVTIQRLVCID